LNPVANFRRCFPIDQLLLAGLYYPLVEPISPSSNSQLFSPVNGAQSTFVPILEKGEKKFSLSPDLFKFDWFLKPPVEFINEDHLIKMLRTKVIEPAEKKCESRQRQLKRLFK
jgi:hypothetical protein